MADTKISALTSGSPAVSTDALPAARSGANVKLTVTDLLTAAGVQSIPASNVYFFGTAGNVTATGLRATAGGKEALNGLTSAADCTALGYRAGYLIAAGSYNTAIGTYALQSLSGGSATGNTAIGASAGQAATTATNNTVIGFQASYSGAAASSITAIGRAAMYTNTGSYYSTAIGAYALYSYTGAGVNIATAIGSDAGYQTTTAANFTAIGRRAGYSHTTGADSTYVGADCGYSGLATTNTGIGITAIGNYANGHNTTGSYNTSVGRAAQWYGTTGSQNTAIGYRAGYGNATGSNNTAVGYYAGHNSANQGHSVFIGASADMLVPAAGSWAASPSAGAGLANSTLLYSYRVAFLIGGAETGFSEPVDVTITAASGNYQVSHTAIPVYSGPKTCTARRLFRTPGRAAGGADHLYQLVVEIADNTTTTYTDSTPDGSLGAAPVAPSNAIAIGSSAKVHKSGQLVVGSTTSRISSCYVGGGVDDTSPSRVTLSSSDASGANLASAGITIAGGMSTGTADGGSVRLAASRAGGAGSTGNALVDLLEMFANAHVFVANVVAAPSGSPSGGGWLYVEAGALKYKGSGGTITTIAAA